MPPKKNTETPAVDAVITPVEATDVVSATTQVEVETPSVEAAAPAPTASREDELEKMIARLTQQNVELMTALHLTNTGKKAEEPKHRVTNVGGSSVSFQITNPSTGQKEHIHLGQRGDFKELTLSQITELNDRCAFLFEQGHIVAPDAIKNNPNVVANVDKFIDTLPLDAIDARIGAITSPDTLWAIWNTVESRRFSNKDANNVILSTDEDGTRRPAIRELPANSVLRALQVAISARITELTNVQPRMT